MCRHQISTEILSEIASYFNCKETDLLIEKRIGDGKSGDQVYLIVVSNPANLETAGEYILKIKKGSSSNEFNEEISNTHSAKQKCYSTKIKIPELQFFSKSFEYYIYDVAGVGIKETSTLYVQIPEKKQSRLADFINASLFAWEKNYSTTSATTFQMFQSWIGEKRLSPSSRLLERIRKFISDELSEAWCADNSMILPNPYYYFTCATQASEKQSVINNVLQGPQHGDLNQKNILIQPLERGNIYYVIDFSHYRNNNFLFFDQVYLLLDILLDIDGILLTDWIEHLNRFFDILINKSKFPTSNNIFFKYFNAFIDGWLPFYSRYPQNGRSIIIQMLCACAAVGLNFMNKSAIAESKQIFSFAFSSIAVKKLVELGEGVTPDENNEYPKLYIGAADGISKIWNIADGFSQNNRYILISSCLSENISSDNFCAMEPIPWAAIIEVNHLLDNDLRSKALQRFRRRQGYRHILLTDNSETDDFGEEAVWCSIVVDSKSKNKNIFYSKHIQPRFSSCLESVFSRYEKYPLCIFVDSQYIDMSICNLIITDLLVAVGENTMVDVISLSDCEIQVDEEAYIKVHQIPCDLNQIAINIQMSFKSYDDNNILIPSANSLVILESVMMTEIENDMKIIHRNLTNTVDDDQGDAFYRGGEATWHDISCHRDAERIDYTNVWHDRIKNKLIHLHSSGSSIMWLYHMPGGGGTTMAKRIMWDFCSQYPTVYLQKISDLTAERLKMLYQISINNPLLIIAEINDSAISNISLSALRTELIKKNVRALFICISRKNERPKKGSSLAFNLPDTPQMYMLACSDEAINMYHKFSERLDSEKDRDRLGDLNDLTYTDTYSNEIRQPFFYGLFAFGENYQSVEKYVRNNLQNVSEHEKLMLSILAFNTIYSQTVNLNIHEVAYILFPEHTLDRNTFDETRNILSKNCFVVHRGEGYRISHPLIARELLEKILVEPSYIYNLINLAKKLVECLGTLYSFQSPRLDAIVHELFIHREPITEDQRTVFSTFITELPDDRQRIDIMNFLREKFPANPHYSNHLARLYLKPLDEDQLPDIINAKKYADEAIQRAKNLNEDSGSIHHHLMGKVYSRECISKLKQLIGRNHVSYAIKQISPIYQNAVREFNICSFGRNSGYGLVGKLELINKMLEVVKEKLNSTISRILNKEQSIRGSLIGMIAEAGNIIQQYTISIDDSGAAFRSALLKFYRVMGNISDIERFFYTNEPNLKIRANSRRSIVTIMESNACEEDTALSYNKLNDETLTQINTLMDENIYTDGVGINSDRFRWLESYRRLEKFELSKAYQFLMDWPESSDNLDVSYYRYVIAFLFYAKYQGTSYQVVKQHLLQCQQLAQKAYGKYITVSRDLLGKLDCAQNDKDALAPWQYYELGLSQEERDNRNKSYREKQCEFVTGSVSSIKDGMVDFRFSVENAGNTLFYAKAPKIGVVSSLLDGQRVKFHLGFSYSGFRAWDITPLE